jgi:hypothetical protein
MIAIPYMCVVCLFDVLVDYVWQKLFTAPGLDKNTSFYCLRLATAANSTAAEAATADAIAAATAGGAAAATDAAAMAAVTADAATAVAMP